MRLRAGELLALIGAVGVIVALFLRNYENAAGKLTGLDTFGPAVALMLLAAVAALALVAVTAAERSSALPIAAAVWTTVFAIAGLIAAVVRVLERPHHAIEVCAGSWLALGGAVAILAGAWLSMRDERTSLYDEASPETRPPPSP
jgi:drug/metabolite transporter (DMT)-like permease